MQARVGMQDGIHDGIHEKLRALARRLVPGAVRVEVARLRRLPAWVMERRAMARAPVPVAARAAFGHELAAHETPLARVPGQVPPRLQRGKERNVALAARLIDGIALEPGQLFSYHHAVGRPSRLRGFRPGLELRDGRPATGIGGGCCAVSNLLYLLALRAGLAIVERHRHALDLFPDHGRTVPFGCGATVFYNQADLRFANTLSVPVLLQLEVAARTLHGRITCRKDPGLRVEIYEVGHRLFRDGDGGGAWWRENHIHRRIRRLDGTVVVDHEVAYNRGRLAYQPEQAACGGR
jgi:vancomycin resistance protein VanW